MIGPDTDCPGHRIGMDTAVGTVVGADLGTAGKRMRLELGSGRVRWWGLR